ncbi:unnamed protein product [Penicillium pancosmium]
MASSQSSTEVPHLVALIKTLTNPQLKDLLRNEGLAVSGVKASLQIRIIDYLERLATSEGNDARYDALKRRVYQSAIPGAMSFQSNTNFQSSQPTQPTPPHSRAAPASASMGSSSHPHGQILFKDSPFFTILTSLTSMVECKVREQTRDSVELKVILSASAAADLQADPTLRVMVYCAADSGLKSYTKSDIAFPHQVELKVNLDEVKANLRGLKNRPGTTQPADVTNYIRKKPNYTNNIVMTYALTQKKFFALINLVRLHPVNELVGQLQTRKLISKEQVIREMKNRAQDSDIVATSSVMSLKCPLSTLRIQVPCRSIVCTHNQCFDASSFLELQKQAPTWTCPVCSKSTSFESLQVDQYVDEILQSTSTDVDQVVVEPSGDWTNPTDSDIAKPGGVTPASDDDDDDDLIEISQPGFPTPTVKQEPISSSTIMLERTPAQSQSRETSTPSSAIRASSKKRPASAIIDLTASDDEDDESPMPPIKRPALNFAVRGLPPPDHPRSYPPQY